MSLLKIEARELPDNHPWRELPPDSPMQLHGSFDARHKGRSFSVLLTRDDLAPPRGLPDWRWHLSIAGRDMKVPVWETVAAIAHEVRPGVAFVLGVPPKSWWINVHPGTLHLHEIRDENLLANWRAQRLGHTPT
jgi:hypothetical protein